MCHTDVEGVLQAMANSDQQAEPSSSSGKKSGPLFGGLRNSAAPYLALLQGAKSLSLEEVCTNGIPPEYIGVAIHAQWGLADEQSEMVRATRDHFNVGETGGAAAGATHSIAILDIDKDHDTAYIFDPDYTRNTADGERMRQYCSENNKEPSDLTFDEIESNSWIGELIRKVPASALKSKCHLRIGVGVVGVPKK